MEASLLWDSAVGAYRMKFERISRFEWDKLKLLTSVVKTLIPAGRRDYDDKTKTWFFEEQYFDAVKTILENNLSNVNVFKRPDTDTGHTTHFVPIETDFSLLAELMGVSEDEIKSKTLEEATKLYRSTAMRLHPDRNPQGATDMSRLNETWTRLKAKNVFKTAVTV